MSLWQRRFLYFTIFFSGFTTLAIELSASRLLGNVFGTSIIGLILIYLTAGYFVGGRVADRYPNPKTLYTILAWGAFTSGIMPLIAQPVLYMAADAFDQLEIGVLLGSFTSVLILFSVPVTLLGMVSPFAIRLMVDDPQSTGKTAGQIYGISTIGSFLGTFFPVLLFIPLFGTLRTFLLCSGFLLLVSLVGLFQVSGLRSVLKLIWMPIILGIFALVAIGKPIKKTQGQIFETESAYNYIQVIEKDGYRYLRLNEGQGYHSVWHPTQLSYTGTWEQFLAAPFFNSGVNGIYDIDRVRSIAIVGLAGGTVARQATAVFGPIPIDGFEIDPVIIEVGRAYFGMNEPNLRAIAQDGRWGLAHSNKRYTLICIDAYRPPYIPPHLTTQEFFQIVRDHLEEDGSVAINVGRAPDDRRLIEGLVGTMQTVFSSVYVMDVPDTFNSIVYATVKPTRIENLYTNLLYLYTLPNIHPLLITALESVITNQRETPRTEIVFTDDRAPIEWITNTLVLNFVLKGNMEILQ
jgi:predicted membrane-bound spermidine synthase